jgi:hypothetical protein
LEVVWYMVTFGGLGPWGLKRLTPL